MIDVRMSPIVSPYLPAPRAGRIGAPAPCDPSDTFQATPAAPSPEASRSPLAVAGLAVATALSVLAPSAASLAALPATQATVATAPRGQSLLSEHIPAHLRPQVEATLQRVPDRVLRALEKNGTKIVILGENDTPLSAGLVSPVDPQADYGDPSALATRAAAAMQRVDLLFGPRISKLEKELRGAPRLGDKASDDAIFEAEAKRLDLDELKADRDALSRRAANEATEGLVEPARTIDEVTTLQQLAHDHGAETPEQIGQFVSLTRSLNPGTNTDGPLRLTETKILIPSIRWFKATDTSAPMLLREHDAASIVPWSDGAVAGQYFYIGSHAVAVHAGAFGVPEGTRPVGPHGSPDNGRHVLLHELGHAYEDAVRRQSPQGYEAFRAERDQAWLRLQNRNDHPFAHRHESSSPSEMTAETFATSHDGDMSALRRADPRWVRAYENLK